MIPNKTENTIYATTTSRAMIDTRVQPGYQNLICKIGFKEDKLLTANSSVCSRLF